MAMELVLARTYTCEGILVHEELSAKEVVTMWLLISIFNQ